MSTGEVQYTDNEFVLASPGASSISPSDLISPMSTPQILPVAEGAGETQGVPPQEFLLLAVFPTEPEPAPVIGPKKSEKFYFEDGSVELLVEGLLYKIHQSTLLRHSSWFRERLRCSLDALLPGWESYSGSRGDQFFVNHATRHVSLSPPRIVDAAGGPITLEEVSAQAFDSFVSVLYPDDYDHYDLHTQTEWEDALKLATRWSFASIRTLAIRHLDTLLDASPLDRLVLARSYNVDYWAEQAIRQLCTRSHSLGVNEVRQMKEEDIALICAVREANAPTLLYTEANEQIRRWREANTQPDPEKLDAPNNDNKLQSTTNDSATASSTIESGKLSKGQIKMLRKISKKLGTEAIMAQDDTLESQLHGEGSLAPSSPLLNQARNQQQGREGHIQDSRPNIEEPSQTGDAQAKESQSCLPPVKHPFLTAPKPPAPIEREQERRLPQTVQVPHATQSQPVPRPVQAARPTQCTPGTTSRQSNRTSSSAPLNWPMGIFGHLQGTADESTRAAQAQAAEARAAQAKRQDRP